MEFNRIISRIKFSKYRDSWSHTIALRKQLRDGNMKRDFSANSKYLSWTIKLNSRFFFVYIFSKDSHTKDAGIRRSPIGKVATGLLTLKLLDSAQQILDFLNVQMIGFVGRQVMKVYICSSSKKKLKLWNWTITFRILIIFGLPR